MLYKPGTVLCLFRYGTGAPACLTLTHYTELLDSVGVVLVRGDIVNDKLVSQPEVRAMQGPDTHERCIQCTWHASRDCNYVRCYVAWEQSIVCITSVHAGRVHVFCRRVR